MWLTMPNRIHSSLRHWCKWRSLIGIHVPSAQSWKENICVQLIVSACSPVPEMLWFLFLTTAHCHIQVNVLSGNIQLRLLIIYHCSGCLCSANHKMQWPFNQIWLRPRCGRLRVFLIQRLPGNRKHLFDDRSLPSKMYKYVFNISYLFMDGLHYRQRLSQTGAKYVFEITIHSKY